MPRVVAGMVASISPQTPAGPVPLEEGGWPAPAFVKLQQDPQTFRLPSDATRYQKWAIRIAERNRQPIYLAVDDDGLVRDVRLPIVGRVRRLQPEPDGTASVGMDSSPRGLRVAAADAVTLQTLQTAGLDRAILLVTANGHGLIIDARLAPLEAAYRAPAFKAGSVQRKPGGIPVSTVTAESAKKIFAALQNARCGVEGRATCIPFEFPDDGCDARAEEMCDRLLAMTPAVTAGKVWVFQPMNYFTRNSCRCNLPFDYHVAPYILVKVFSKTAKTTKRVLFVLDPALFNRPETLSKWVKELNADFSRVRFSGKEVFEASPDGSGSPMFPGQADQILENCRQESEARNPQPPYPCP